MAKLKQTDKGKRYFLDGDRTQEVTLTTPLPDDFATVEFPDGSRKDVAIGRLTAVLEIPSVLPKIVDVLEQRPVTKEEVEFDYPVKPVKVEIHTVDERTGENIVKWLEGEEAIRWNRWMRELAYKAEELGLNPAWLSLRWNIKREVKR